MLSPAAGTLSSKSGTEIVPSLRTVILRFRLVDASNCWSGFLKMLMLSLSPEVSFPSFGTVIRGISCANTKHCRQKNAEINARHGVFMKTTILLRSHLRKFATEGDGRVPPPEL